MLTFPVFYALPGLHSFTSPNAPLLSSLKISTGVFHSHSREHSFSTSLIMNSYLPSVLNIHFTSSRKPSLIELPESLAPSIKCNWSFDITNCNCLFLPSVPCQALSLWRAGLSSSIVTVVVSVLITVPGTQ